MSRPQMAFTSLLFTIAVAFVGCSGGGGGSNPLPTGGGGGGATVTPAGTATPGATATPTASPTPTPTPTATPTVAPATIIGKIVDAGSGNPIAGITVAVEAATAGNLAGMAGSSAPVGALTATTAADGTFTITNTIASPNQTNFYFDAYGGAGYSNNSIHDQFYPGATFGGGGGTGLNANGVSNIGTLKITNPTGEEVNTLARMNTFRASPGGTAFGNAATLVFDENLMEQGAYWALQVHNAGSPNGGHTCVAIGSPAGCVDPNTYLQSLPGTPISDQSAQNVGETFANWAAVETAVENEGASCGTPYKVSTCNPGDPPTGQGHYVNLLNATKWAGLGEVETGYLTYVQQLQ